MWDSLCTNTKFNNMNICRHVYATGHIYEFRRCQEKKSIVKNIIATLYDMSYMYVCMYVYIVDRLVSIKHMDLEVRTRLPFGSLYLCLFPKCGATCLSSLASGFFQNSPPSGASMIRQPSGICSRKETVLDSAEAWIKKASSKFFFKTRGLWGYFKRTMPQTTDISC